MSLYVQSLFYFQAEISLCRVYKRAGVEDHSSLPRSLPTRASSSSQLDKRHHSAATNFASTERLIQAFGSSGHSHHVADEAEKMSETSGSSSTDHIVNNMETGLGISTHNSYIVSNALAIAPTAPLEDERVDLVQTSRQSCYYNSLVPNFGSSLVPQNGVDDLHRLVNFQQASINHYQTSEFSTFQPPIQSQSSPVPPILAAPPSSVLQAGFSDRLWEWNSVSEGINKDYSINTHHFK